MTELTDNIESSVLITFWDNDECIFSIRTKHYPSYKVGDELAISVNPTAKGETKFPGAKLLREFRTIGKIVHSVEQTINEDFSTSLRIEVHLKPKREQISIESFLEEVNDKTLEEIITSIEVRVINETMEKYRNNIAKAAKALGLTRRGLYLKLTRYGLNQN